jgi:hypothetical protein
MDVCCDVTRRLLLHSVVHPLLSYVSCRLVTCRPCSLSNILEDDNPKCVTLWCALIIRVLKFSSQFYWHCSTLLLSFFRILTTNYKMDVILSLLTHRSTLFNFRVLPTVSRSCLQSDKYRLNLSEYLYSLLSMKTCGVVYVYRCLAGTRYLFKFPWKCRPKHTRKNIYQTTWHYIPKGSSFIVTAQRIRADNISINFIPV